MVYDAFMTPIIERKYAFKNGYGHWNKMIFRPVYGKTLVNTYILGVFTKKPIVIKPLEGHVIYISIIKFKHAT